jgi:hypothetical protein
VGGHDQKAKLLIILNFQARESSDQVLLDLVLDREIEKRKTNNFCLSTKAVDCCRKVLDVRQGCSSRNSWVDPNYPRQFGLGDPNYPSDFLKKIKSSIEASKPVTP